MSEQLLVSLSTLLKSNTLLGTEIPQVGNIFQQLEAVSQLGYPFEQYDGSGQILFSGPIWDNVDRYEVTREVFGAPQFHSRTQLLLAQLGYDPYSWDVIKDFKLCLAAPVFPDKKAVFMSSDYKAFRAQIEVVRKYAKPTDTTIVVRLQGLSKLPNFTIQSVFNPYFTYLRQREDNICVSPDLICEQARQQNLLLEHKNTKGLVDKMTLEGFSPLVGLNLMPIISGSSDINLEILPSGFPYLQEQVSNTPEAQEKRQADPGNFEL